MEPAPTNDSRGFTLDRSDRPVPASPAPGQHPSGQHPSGQGPAGRRHPGGSPPPRLSGRSGYSTFVAFAKVALPAVAVAMLLLIGIWPQIKGTNDIALIDTRDAREQAESLSMLEARFEGVDDSNQPFSVTAHRATHSADDENRVTLEEPKADMTLSDGTWLALVANAGVFQRAAETLELYGDVSLFHDDSFELVTSFALIDLENAAAQGFEPVHGHGKPGLIEAGGFEILDRGAVIVFTGPAQIVLYSDPSAEETSSP